MYQALYRKWRPRSFDDVIGQPHITSTLQNQLMTGRLSHAYLFVGTRGTGKTTCAKILAKAVNCQNPVNGNPCNCCPSCLGIDSGAIMDVEELDAASNNGVDNIRALRDEAVFSPVSVRRRVYIVDEVHMLSTGAFNALLKILEEPPEHLIFILCTTELNKVPATILSRCQRFSFKRITAEDITRRLTYVAEQEHIDLTPDAARLLAGLADGALRDGLSLLDQCAVGGTVDTEQVLRFLGLAGTTETVELLRDIAAKDTAGALTRLNALHQAGKNPASLLSELIGLCRDILLLRVAPKEGSSLLSGRYVMSDLQSFKGVLTGAALMNLIHTLQTAAAELSAFPDQKTAVEVCLIKLCNEEFSDDFGALRSRVSRIEEQLRQGIPASAPAAAVGPENTKAAEPVPEVKPVPVERTPASAPVKPEAAPAPAVPAADPRVLWQQFLDAVRPQLDIPPVTFLTDSNHVIPLWTDKELVLQCNSVIARSILEPEKVQSVLREQASRIAGHPIPVKLTDYSGGSMPRAEDKLDSLSRFGNIKFE